MALYPRGFGVLQSGRDVAAGLVHDASHAIKFGLNEDVDASSAPEDIWDGGGIYTGFPTGSAETITVVSTSTSDTAAGVGARTVRIIGLDTNYNMQTEDVTLNGTTQVVTVATWKRVRSVYVQTAGSTGWNVGTLTVRHTTTSANIFSLIQPGMGQGHFCAFTVPAGYNAELVQAATCTSKSPVTNVDMCMGVCTREFGTGSWRTQVLLAAKSAAGTGVLPTAGGLVIPEKTDVVLRALQASADNIRASGIIEFFLYTK